jgi:hypothetical protein
MTHVPERSDPRAFREVPSRFMHHYFLSFDHMGQLT